MHMRETQQSCKTTHRGFAMHEIAIISGTRPEIIKLAPLYHELCRQPWARVCWVHTGQHDEMATQMLQCFDITPDVVFQRRGAALHEFSAGCREQLDNLIDSRPWSLVLVQGDTESAFLGALAGFYGRVPVAHVEAGLRTWNLGRPFPEEGLRQMISRIARFHFAPTPRAQAALLAEGIPSENILLSGNTVVDAQDWVRMYRGIRRKTMGRGHMLVTVHRRENWGQDVEQICRAIATLAQRYPALQVTFPVHLNPTIRQPVEALLGGFRNVRLSKPLDYLRMQQALADAWLVLTDSGGLQEEAPSFGIPLLVLRQETERPEAVEAGCACLLGTGYETIVKKVEQLWLDEVTYRHMRPTHNPFGDGRACERIVDFLGAALTKEQSVPMRVAPTPGPLAIAG